MPTKKPGWMCQVKAVLAQQDPKDLLKLMGDLYRLSKDEHLANNCTTRQRATEP